MKAVDTLSRSRRDGVVVVIKLSCDEMFFQLDSLAAEFWSLIDGRKTVGMICHFLVAKHGAPASSVNKEAARLVRDLYDHNLIDCDELRNATGTSR